MKVKKKKYVIALPFNHGMGEAIKWLDENRINYGWHNAANQKPWPEYTEKKINYIFEDEGDALMFALRFAV